VFFGSRLVIYKQTKKVEVSWYGNKAQILSKGFNNSGGLKFTFKSVLIDDLKIGDLILIKNNTTCPADILIIDSSQ
jgi:magnesium-transporting ATPase (P-type)